jgi:hypothetical protein
MNALGDLQLRVSQVAMERELKQQASEINKKAEQTNYPDVTKPPDEKATHEAPEPQSTQEPEPEPRREGWWGKLINKVPFFKSPRQQRTSS